MPPKIKYKLDTKIFSKGLIDPLENIDEIKKNNINLLSEIYYIKNNLLFNNNKCYLCENKYKNRIILSNHYKTKCHKNENVKCKYCGKVLLNNAMYMIHIIKNIYYI